MSQVIYVVPWAICDTGSVYVKKVPSESVPAPENGMEYEAWCIRNVMPNPDRRSKDVFSIVDVFNGYKEKMNEKGMSVFSLNNSPEVLKEHGFTKADETETAFIKTRVLKLDKGKKK